MVEVILKSRDGKHNAKGLFVDGKVTVKKGSKINLKCADYFKETKENKALKNNREIVDKNGYLLVDCEFSSPTSSAQFVTGRSVNGYISWRPNDQISLKEYLKKGN